MRLAPLTVLVTCLAAAGCFPLRALTRNLSAPATQPVANKIEDPRRSDARLSVLWIGHATVLIQLDDIFVLTDPMFSDTVGQVSPRLVEPGLDPQNVPPLAAVVVSHMHFDHLSFDSLDAIEDRTAVALVPPGVRASMPRFDFEIRELPRWASYEAKGLRVTAVPVQHVGGRYGIDESLEPRAFTGYVFEYHGMSVYFGGDTAYAPQLFRATRARFPELLLAILPICPNEPRDFMNRTHIDPSQALDAFVLLGAKQMLPVHFDTFINSDDAPGACPKDLRRQVRARQLAPERVPILAIGEQRTLLPK